MKYLKYLWIPIVIILIGSLHSSPVFGAFSVPWTATSTNANSYVYPSAINGNYFNATSPIFIATSTTASSSFANGINLNKGCFSVNGVCVSGTGTPAGSDTQVQFNKAGSFGADSNFTFTYGPGQLSIPNNGWYSLGGNLLAYSSTTNQTTIFGFSAGGNLATTSASPALEETAVGYQAGGSLSGRNNTALGGEALKTTTSGIWNTALGSRTLATNITGKYNMGAGAIALNLATGNDNTGVGTNAAADLTTGNANIAIGPVDLPSNTGNAQMNIGGLLFGTGLYNPGGTGAVSSSASGGKVGISTTTPYATLSVVGAGGVVADNYTGTSTTAISAIVGPFSVGSLATTSSNFYVDPPVGATVIGGGAPLFSGLGTQDDRLTVQTNVNDIQSINMGNFSSGNLAASCLTFQNASTTFTFPGAYYGEECFFGPGWDGTLGSAGKPHGLALYSSDGRLILGTATTSEIDFYASGNNNLASGNQDAAMKGIAGGAALFGIGTTSPGSTLAVQASSTSSYSIFNVASSTNGSVNATSSLLTVTNKGNVVMGNNNFVSNFMTGTTSINALETGFLTLDSDAGVVNLIDLPIVSAAANTAESYSFLLGGTTTLTLYGQANGATSVKNITVGVGTSTPYADFSIAAPTSTVPFDISTSTVTTASTTLYQVDAAGNQHYGGGIPTLSSCGNVTTASLDANSSDMSGTVTTGSAATGCTVTFSIPKSSKPHCIISEQTGSVTNALSYTETTAALTLTQTGMSTTTFDYFCPLGPK